MWHGGCAWQGGMCGRGHVWLESCILGGMHGRGHVWQGGVHGREHTWLGDEACMAGGCAWQGGMHGRGCAWQGPCIVGGHAWQGGMHGRGGPAWQGCMPQQILRDMVNERAVRILLECILVSEIIPEKVAKSLVEF